MAKKNDTYKGFLPYQSELERRYASWPYNHRGWAKMKKANRKLAKKRLNAEFQQDMKNMC